MKPEHKCSTTTLQKIMKVHHAALKSLPLLPFRGRPSVVETFRICQLDYCNMINGCDECLDRTMCVKCYDAICDSKITGRSS
jgi:hypothetical protein